MMKTFANSIAAEVLKNFNSNTLIIKYKVGFTNGCQLVNDLKVIYPITLNEGIDLSLICNYFIIFLSQMFLLQGNISIICSEKDILYYSDILKSLYAIRNYQEGENISFPNITCVTQSNKSMVINSQKPKVLNLISGGKDSLVSDILLKKNDAIIERCFFSGLNIEASTYEKNACEYLYDSFDEIKIVGFNILINKLVEISDCYGNPPINNFIPKGRDLLTVIFSYPLALHYNCNYISLGCEKDLWEKIVVINGQQIPMHDSQCKLVMIPMSEQLYNSTGIRLFSPISGMYEIYLLTWLMKKQSIWIHKMQSCFYDKWCGKCKKCIRYYLIQERIGLNTIKFKSDPKSQLSSLINNLREENAQDKIGYYEELKFLTGSKELEEKLFSPSKCDLFPSFFERWDLND